MAMRRRVKDELSWLAGAGLYRTPAELTSQDASFVFNGRRHVMLASNNYLGLATRPELVEGACEAVRRWGVGSGGSRLTTGTLPCHRMLEERIAQLKGCEDAVLFGSGYEANVGARGAALVGAVVVELKDLDLSMLERMLSCVDEPLPEVVAVAVQDHGLEGCTVGNLVARLALPIVVVARPSLGTLNHTLLTIEYARSLGIEVLGIVVSGYRGTLTERTNMDALEGLQPGVGVMGIIPHSPVLAGGYPIEERVEECIHLVERHVDLTHLMLSSV